MGNYRIKSAVFSKLITMQKDLVAEDFMVAGDTKKIIVIKNISSNLIEEAILILKSEPGTKECNQLEKPVQGKMNEKNDFILKEAESIINQYIRENGLIISHNKHRLGKRKFPCIHINFNVFINILLMAAIAFLILIVGRFI